MQRSCHIACLLCHASFLRVAIMTRTRPPWCPPSSSIRWWRRTTSGWHRTVVLMHNPKVFGRLLIQKSRMLMYKARISKIQWTKSIKKNLSLNWCQQKVPPSSSPVRMAKLHAWAGAARGAGTWEVETAELAFHPLHFSHTCHFHWNSWAWSEALLCASGKQYPVAAHRFVETTNQLI